MLKNFITWHSLSQVSLLVELQATKVLTASSADKGLHGGSGSESSNSYKPRSLSAYLDVAVPADVVAGQTIQVKAPDGQRLQAFVPHGAAPGSTFRIEYSACAPTDAAAAAVAGVETQAELAVKDAVSRLLPGSEIVSTTAGSFVIGVPKSLSRSICRFFLWVESQDVLIKESGISNTTLEEVFLRIASTSNTVNAPIIDFSAENALATLMVPPDQQLSAVLRWLALEHLEGGLRTAGTDLQSIVMAGLGQLGPLPALGTDSAAADSAAEGACGASGGGEHNSVRPIRLPLHDILAQLKHPEERWMLPTVDDGNTTAPADNANTTVGYALRTAAAPSSAHGRAQGVQRAALWGQIIAYFFKSFASERRQRFALYFRLFILLILTVMTLAASPSLSFGDDDTASPSALINAQPIAPLLFQFATYLW
jgi:hypothetical protein